MDSFQFLVVILLGSIMFVDPRGRIADLRSMYPRLAIVYRALGGVMVTIGTLFLYDSLTG